MIVMLQTQRLLFNRHQFGMIAQIQSDQGGVRLQQLTQAQLHPIRVRTMMFQSLGDRLFNQLGRVLLVKLEHLNKLTDTSPIGLPTLQFSQELFIDRRPA